MLTYVYRYKKTSTQIVRAVWNKATPIHGKDQNVWRKDMCETMIKFSEHGETNRFGWEIDHIKPVAEGGKDDLSNLQPLFWRANRSKGDAYPWDCSML
jgi:hypothetical protein